MCSQCSVEVMVAHTGSRAPWWVPIIHVCKQTLGTGCGHLPGQAHHSREYPLKKADDLCLNQAA